MAQDRFTHVYKGMPPDHCCCDQALRVLPDGTWAIFFMTGGEHEPRPENYIVMCRSTDRGETWSKPETVLQFDDRACLLSEVFVHDGVVTIIAETHGGFFEDWRVWWLRSDDNAATWQPLEELTAAPRRSFPRNRYVATWGEWFLPLQTYDVVEDPSPSPLKDGTFKQCMNGCLYSGDEGRTWKRSNLVGPIADWAENNLVELRDGSMVMLVRADGTGHLKRCVSEDHGRTWSEPEPTDIPNPGTKFRLFRLSDGRIVLLHNPNGVPRQRNPLALWVSDDDMASWPYRRQLTDFPGQLQYPDGVVSEDQRYVHFAFDYNRHDEIFWSARIPVE